MENTCKPLNYRDVGETLRFWLDPSPLAAGRLFRGGKFDSLMGIADLGYPRTILNLRRGLDSKHLSDVIYLHVPAANDMENYDTSQRSVQLWLGKVLGVFMDENTIWPIYMHCTSGRDRTGIVVAATLFLLDIPRSIIIEEYMLSDGAQQMFIEQALDGLAKNITSFGIDRKKFKKMFCGM